MTGTAAACASAATGHCSEKRRNQVAGRCSETGVWPTSGRPCPHVSSRMAPFPWMKALLIFCSSSRLNLPVRSGMPHAVAGPLTDAFATTTRRSTALVGPRAVHAQRGRHRIGAPLPSLAARPGCAFLPVCCGYASSNRSTHQNGYCVACSLTLTHWAWVNSSMLAGPPNRPPLPDAPMPPNGTWGSQLTGWSLM